ncbi:MAG: OFA family MFS transporter [Gammaproteobacteria bacterium]|nr:OFA family MFS transporter [Gammaproteobacteria bacterium]
MTTLPPSPERCETWQYSNRGVEQAVAGTSASAGFLDKERIIAPPGFNRWLVPPAALAIHLCIGMAYGFSVFWLPLSKAIGITKPISCPKDMSWLAALTTTACDWKIALLGWMFTLFFVFLGTASALWGGWLERVGPRKAGVVAALCWCGGLVISALGVSVHQLWLLWLGSGVIGGLGLGLGYISPVSTLIKWFPDRRGMATGMAIMGFGGGAMIGSPLADRLMKLFATPTSVGVWQTFLTLAAIYFVFMMGGAFGYRLPQPGWQPAGWTPASPGRRALVTDRNVHLSVAWRTPQFWLLWGVLTLNVAAGIGIIGMASPLLQEVFGGRLIGTSASFEQLTQTQLATIATLAAGFTGLLSLFNIAGRIFWASLSDYIGRKSTYMIFFLLGFVLYASEPWTAAAGNLALFVGSFCIILSMYGGGFATVPAYLADLFGTRMVGAIHGRLLTAWSTAGVLGPVLVNYIREYQLDHGVPRAQVYSVTMYVLAGLLALGFVCNLLIRPVNEKNFMTASDLAATDAAPGAISTPARAAPARGGTGASSPALWVAAAWLAVGIPIAWGLWVTVQKAVTLFGS